MSAYLHHAFALCAACFGGMFLEASAGETAMAAVGIGLLAVAWWVV